MNSFVMNQALSSKLDLTICSPALPRATHKREQRSRKETHMPRRKLMLIFSVAIAALLVTAMLLPTSPIVPASRAQTASRDVDGSSERPAEDLESRFDNAEAYDKESIEADPYAPDDSEAADSGSTTSTNSTNSTAAAAPAAKLYPIPVPLPGGLAHVANGVGTRDAGYGTIRSRGVPPGSVRVGAYLYWGTIQTAPPPTQTILFKGVPVTGRLIGTGPSCWSCGGTFAAYRASVISLINPGINGDYLVSRMPSAITNGSDPWKSPCMLPLSEGASLVIAYAHSSIPPSAKLYINDGAAFFASGSINVLNPLPTPLPPYKQLKHTRLGGDGQVVRSAGTLTNAPVPDGTFSTLPITNERTFLGTPLTQIKGAASPFNGDSDWNGDDGVPLNQLWDTHTDSFLKPLIPFGATGYNVVYTSNGDCIYAVAHILNTF
jgi:hypothetical protein